MEIPLKECLLMDFIMESGDRYFLIKLISMETGEMGKIELPKN